MVIMIMVIIYSVRCTLCAVSWRGYNKVAARVRRGCAVVGRRHHVGLSALQNISSEPPIFPTYLQATALKSTGSLISASPTPSPFLRSD
jgi:hypothetical protein